MPTGIRGWAVAAWAGGTLGGLRLVLALIQGWRRLRGHGPIPEREENGKNPWQ